MLTPIPLAPKQVLMRAGDPIEFVYFPWGGVCSVVATMSDARGVEIATVGPEGVVGYLAGFGEQISEHECMLQIPASDSGAYRMASRDFHREMSQSDDLRRAVQSYMLAAHVLIATSVACNALHSAEERCARWLLMVHDRIGVPEFYLSHEFLALMLGVRRPTATLVAGTLQSAGLIRYKRARIEVLDREGLEHASCECYAVVARRFREGPSTAS